GWKRAVTDYLVNHVTTTNRALRADSLSGGLEGQVSIAALSRMFRENADALAEVYTPAEMNNLRRVHKILEPLGNLGRKATGGSDTVENQLRAQNEPARNALEAFIKLKFGGLRGGNIMRNIGLLTKNLPHNSVQADKLLSRMWFDPQVASVLMERDIKQVGTPAWNSKLTKLLGYGAAARADAQGAPDNETQPPVYREAASKYPILKNLGISAISTPKKDRGYLEFWPPNETGGSDYPRPNTLPMGKPGIEIYRNDTRPIDVLGDVVSHYLVGKDPTVTKAYDKFVSSMTPEQKSRLKDNYQWAKDHENEKRPYAEWAKTSGIPAYFRGYTFDQWKNAKKLYTPKQIKRLDKLRSYLGIESAKSDQNKD
ncbi:MAG TPA: hypothetical protein VKA19_06635, partial [Alphaproteobacteria bacterium]|nr:hypothetical protein [Alphaproteobacteria bacterium]